MKTVNAVFFWGSLWGITEATIGHLLHLWSLPIGWLVWFPLAYGFMWLAYRQTGKLKTLFLTALVASLIKLVDFLTPVRSDLVFNPAVSIILEGLAVFIVYNVTVRQNENCSIGLRRVAIASFLWRALYSIYVLFLPTALVKISPVYGAAALVRFLLFESAANSLLIYVTGQLFLKSRLGIERCCFSPHPALSLGILLSACLIQWSL